MSRLCSPSVPAVCAFKGSQGFFFFLRSDRALLSAAVHPAASQAEGSGPSDWWGCSFALHMGHPQGSLRSAFFAVCRLCDF